jgi:hypothetical protein
VRRDLSHSAAAPKADVLHLYVHADEALQLRKTGHEQASSSAQAEDCIRCLILGQPQPLCIASERGPTRLHRLLLHASARSSKPVCNTSVQLCS